MTRYKGFSDFDVDAHQARVKTGTTAFENCAECNPRALGRSFTRQCNTCDGTGWMKERLRRTEKPPAPISPGPGTMSQIDLPTLEKAPEAPRRRNRREEGELQAQVVEWLKLRYPHEPWFANGNGAHIWPGEHHFIAAMKAARRMGETVPESATRTAFLTGLYKKIESAKYGEITRLEQQGRSNGVPDLFLPVRRFDEDGYIAALRSGDENPVTAIEWAELVAEYIHPGQVWELKTPSGRLSEDQKRWWKMLEAQGWDVNLGTEFHDVTSRIERYLG